MSHGCAAASDEYICQRVVPRSGCRHPRAARIDDPEALRSTLGQATSTALMPMCDQASSHWLLLRQLGLTLAPRLRNSHAPSSEVLSQGVPRAHDPPLQHGEAHPAEVAEGAYNPRLGALRGRMNGSCRGTSPRQHPLHTQLLGRIFFDSVAPYHKRRHWVLSAISGLERVGRSCGRRHRRRILVGPPSWAPRSDSRQQAAERKTVSCANALMSSGDPAPAESRWAHVLPNRSTLLSRVSP